MKIYTSNFGKTKSLIKAGIKPIGIALYTPSWYEMSGGKSFKLLAPTRENLKMQSNVQYTMVFNDMLERLDADNVFMALLDLAGEKDIALLCFEKSGDFCHRRLVADWFKKHLGIVIDEWRDDSVTLATPKMPTVPTLFD